MDARPAEGSRGGESHDGSADSGGNPDAIEQFVARKDHHPSELKSWAKRTGFVSNFAGDTVSSPNAADEKRREGEAEQNSATNGRRPLSRFPVHEIKIDPPVGTTPRNGEIEVESKREQEDGPASRDNVARSACAVNGGDQEGPKDEERDVGLDVRPNDDDEEERPVPAGPSALKCGLNDKPGLVPLLYYGFQHYFSLMGSLVFMPLIMVPAMGGNGKDCGDVICTTLLISGITTLLHTLVGTRLPLVQGSSFVYLAPALLIANSRYERTLAEHRFKHIIRELQGAIIVSSTVQSVLGLSGFMSLLMKVMSPAVIAPTVAAIGLGYINIGFSEAGKCVEISVPQIVLILVFSIHLRGVSVMGKKAFRTYAVPLSTMIVWAYAFFLTTGGVYDYDGCADPNIPTSNILTETCRSHATRIRNCRTDVSNAWRTSDWVRIPYPFQWGTPIFRIQTSAILIIVSLVSSVDSAATYQSTSLMVSRRRPTPAEVSRGIGVEGVCSILAGFWGTGAASTTLAENAYTIYVTKAANLRAVQIGACVLILTSFFGKVGAVLASMPAALAAAVLCFVWALTVAMGLLNLGYTGGGVTHRDAMIVGVSVFLGLSISAYAYRYQPITAFVLPPYLIPSSAASDGPVRSGGHPLDFSLNAVLSLNAVVTFCVAFVLDVTSPRGRRDRAVMDGERSTPPPPPPPHEPTDRSPSLLHRWIRVLRV